MSYVKTFESYSKEQMNSTKVKALTKLFRFFTGTNQGLQIAGKNMGHPIPCYIESMDADGVLVMGVNNILHAINLTDLEQLSDFDRRLVNASIGDLIGRYPQQASAELYI